MYNVHLSICLMLVISRKSDQRFFLWWCDFDANSTNIFTTFPIYYHEQYMNDTY